MPKNIALLPSGFTDLLPPEAESEARAIHVLMEHFRGYGYGRVKPPLAEFEDSLFAPGPGAALMDQTFRLMDPVSHKMLGLRADITAQIARIASTRMASDMRPLRLTYANDVLRTRAGQQRTLRQFCQVGGEIIGLEDVQADIEIAVMALSGLCALGVRDITLDLALPRMVEALLQAHDVDAALRMTLHEALRRKDVDGLKSSGQAAGVLLAALVEAAGNPQDVLAKITALDLPQSVRADLAHLGEVAAGLSEAAQDLGLADIRLSFDPAEFKGYEYHKGVAFTLFAPGAPGELGAGGRYDIARGAGQAESATGFTLYMDTVMRALPAASGQDLLFVGFDVRWQDLKKLRDEGWHILRGDAARKAPAFCTHIYKNGSVEKL